MRTILIFSMAHGTVRIPAEEIDCITMDNEIPCGIVVNLKNGKEIYLTKQLINIEQE